MQTLLPDTTLQSGKYTIKKVLGQGGFGITYLAEHNMLGTKVAIKEFFFKQYCDRDESTSHVTIGTVSNRDEVLRYQEKFLKEARTIARLNHPNIIKIHDVFKENDTAYYVMDFVEGESLLEIVKRQGTLSESEAFVYIRQIGSALSYIHAEKLNHLDVKPSNIMIAENGQKAVLIDFGTSKQYDYISGNQTSTTPVGISHGYAAIEQYKEGGVGEFTPQTDIYSLGATLYKLITGNTPAQATEIAVDGWEPSYPSGISSSTRKAIGQAMEIRKQQRPISVDAFLDMLVSVSTNTNSTFSNHNDDNEASFREEETLINCDFTQQKEGQSRMEDHKRNEEARKPFLQINSTLQGGKYVIKKVLGQGGFGITYLAEHCLSGTKVAIQEFFIHDLNSRDESTSRVSIGSDESRELAMKFRDRFIKSARSIAQFNHPNIISIRDIFEENGTAYCVMEYCEGESLSELLKLHSVGLGEALSVKYIRQVASALEYIHERKMNHLDVKPANIMLKGGNAVLVGFDLAKQYDSTGKQTSTTPDAISPGYAPIEQYRQDGVSYFSPATDIYSLGATLYKLITGQTPPDVQTLLEEDLPTINASAPVANAIRQAMQVKRSNRPQSIAAWLQLLSSSSQSSIDEESTQVFQFAWQEKEEEERRQREFQEKIDQEVKAEEDYNNKSTELPKTQKSTNEEKIRWSKENPSRLDTTYHDSLGFVYGCILAGSVLTIIWAPFRLLTSQDFATDFIWDTLPCILLGILGLVGALGLRKRKTGSVFVCLVYSWLCTLSNILTFIISIIQGIFPGIWSLAWLVYGSIMIFKLYASEEIKLIFPKEYRKVSTLQWILSIINILFFSIIFFGLISYLFL